MRSNVEEISRTTFCAKVATGPEYGEVQPLPGLMQVNVGAYRNAVSGGIREENVGSDFGREVRFLES